MVCAQYNNNCATAPRPHLRQFLSDGVFDDVVAGWDSSTRRTLYCSVHIICRKYLINHVVLKIKSENHRRNLPTKWALFSLMRRKMRGVHRKKRRRFYVRCVWECVVVWRPRRRCCVLPSACVLGWMRSVDPARSTTIPAAAPRSRCANQHSRRVVRMFFG